MTKTSKLIYGFGENDLKGCSKTRAFACWYNMIRRCYDTKYKVLKPTYTEAVVCEEWRLFSAFKKWFDEHCKKEYENYVLDKDIISKGNKVYSPSTCCLVPPEVNAVLTKSDKQRGSLPIGVKLTASGKRFEARLSINKQYYHLGTYDSPELAFIAYKAGKQAWIKKLAYEYYTNGYISQRVYEALQNYQVEFSD